MVSNWASRQNDSFGARTPQCEHHPISSGMHHQPELVGGRLGARGAIGGEVKLVRLDQVLGLPARAVDVLVEMLRCACEVGDDEARVGALWSGLDAGDDTTGAGIGRFGPGAGGIVDLAMAAHFRNRSLQAPERDILGQFGNLAQQHAVAGQAKDVADTTNARRG